MNDARERGRMAGAAHGGLLLLLSMCAAACLAQGSKVPQASARLSIDPNEIVAPVSPILYGLMTEEINHSYDGGLYAELLQNRTFRTGWQGPRPWTLVQQGNSSDRMEMDKTTGPSQALSTSLKVTVQAASQGNEAGVSNSGYWGIGLRPHTAYHGSFYAKAGDDGIGPVVARLVSDKTGAVLAEAQVTVHPGPWSWYQYTLTTGAMAPSATNHLQLTVAHSGTLWLQLVSLMPPTFNNRPNGNRVDLMQHMAGLHPHFLRLPGGNYLEGDTLRDWYNFKETIGPLVDRPGHQAPWTYWSTDGLGLLEFLEWCEDLRVEPVLAVYAGYALKGAHAAPGKDLDPYIQAALDEVEYVTGEVNTKWGAMRVRDGHPAPFPLHYIEIGNEDWLDKSGSYTERYPPFARALRAKYPQFKLIATMPVKDNAPETRPDVVDDHYYKSAADMFQMAHHYDNAPRNGPKIFVGEWATLEGMPTPDFGAALADAAFMTSMERNSDLIIMAAYAPLLVNVNPQASQWMTNLIGYDALNSFVSPSYHAQSMFGGHIGDGTPRSSITGAGERFFYSATVGSADHVLHLKMVNASDREQPLSIDLHGGRATTAKMTSLHAASYEATNTITDPEFVHPVDSTMKVTANTWQHTVPALTIEVVDIPLR